MTLVLRVLLVLRVVQEHRDHLDKEEILVPVEHLVQQEALDSQEHEATQVLQDLPDNLELEVI